MNTNQQPPPKLGDDEGRLLLELAARALARHYGVPARHPGPDPERLPPRLRTRRGVFVTLKRGGALRGCLGSIEGRSELWRDVEALAVEAARNDPRFVPVSAAELPALTVSVSVMTPPSPIAPDVVAPGRHGLIVRRGSRSGLLLPQVATEFGWDRETFLDHTCLKAGLEPGAWRDPATELLAFEAQVFGPEAFERLV